MSRLSYESHEADGHVRVALRGELDLSSADRIEDVLKQAEERRPELLVLDLRDLTFMDSTGLRLMVAADARARDASRRFAIVQGPETVHRVFRITGLEEHLDIVAAPPAGSGGEG